MEVPDKWKNLKLELKDEYVEKPKNNTKQLFSCRYECGFKGKFEDMYQHHLNCPLNKNNLQKINSEYNKSNKLKSSNNQRCTIL